MLLRAKTSGSRNSTRALGYERQEAEMSSNFSLLFQDVRMLEALAQRLQRLRFKTKYKNSKEVLIKLNKLRQRFIYRH
jgi:hypothetical protein